MCGEPITPVLDSASGPVQYFENLALLAAADGRVALLPIGAAALRDREAHAIVVPADGGGSEHVVQDVSRDLPHHATRRYATRPLSLIRHLVLHHTGASATLSPAEIAIEHVEANGWPGIGYHFVIDRRGNIAQTQDLTVETYHARQFNPASVGIALAGDFSSSVPDPAQLEAAAILLCDLLRDLGLPLGAIRGHREMVQTTCPGEAFGTLWKPRLLRLVEARLAE
jgi:hypothetical protein